MFQMESQQGLKSVNRKGATLNRDFNFSEPLSKIKVVVFSTKLTLNATFTIKGILPSLKEIM